MNLLSFLQSSVDLDFFKKNTKICFIAPDYSLLFFSLLMRGLKERNLPIQSLDLSIDEASIKAQLSMCFLDQTSIFWLSDLSSFESKSKGNLFIDYLSQYQGPNAIIFFLKEKNDLLSKTVLTLDFTSGISEEDYKSLFNWLYPSAKLNSPFIKTVFKKVKSLSLDQATLLINYNVVIGSKIEKFATEWFDNLIPPTQSLFDLSNHFFAKNSKDFFVLWHAIADKYPHVFWVTFWSEQLFRAYSFSVLNEQKNYVAAKKMAFRLPFAFIQRNWRNIQLQELVNAHAFIYNLDLAIKSGSTIDAVGLELFYTKFLNSDFTL